MLQNTYYHLNFDCVRRKYPFVEPSDIIVHEEMKQKLTLEHKRHALKIGLVL